MTAHPHISDRARLRRPVGLALIACLALALAACSASESSSEQLPIGPAPSITVLLRVGGDGGTSVQLLATGATQEALNAAAGAVARAAFPTAAFPTAQIGAPQASTSTDSGLTVSTVPVQLPTTAMDFTLDSDSMSAALQPVHPKAVGVWVCTDDRRSLSVNSAAPGAVSSDIVSGQCQVAGSTLAHDGPLAAWTTKVSVGAVEAPSKLPWLIGAAIVVALILGAWFLWPRRSKQLETSSASPPLPPVPPVH